MLLKINRNSYRDISLRFKQLSRKVERCHDDLFLRIRFIGKIPAYSLFIRLLWGWMTEGRNKRGGEAEIQSNTLIKSRYKNKRKGE